MLLKYLINMDRKTKIIATVGPSLASKEKIHSAINSVTSLFKPFDFELNVLTPI